MKIRNGFVSNSSSSSFTCCISGGTESGWDICMAEAGMVECKQGHIYYEDYLRKFLHKLDNELDDKQVQAVFDKMDDYYSEEYAEVYNRERSEGASISDALYDTISEVDDGRYGIPVCLCPVCQLQYITDDDLLEYLLRENNMTKAELVAHIQETVTPEEFYKGDE